MNLHLDTTGVIDILKLTVSSPIWCPSERLQSRRGKAALKFMRQPLRYRNAKLPKKLPAEVSDLHVLRGRVAFFFAFKTGIYWGYNQP